LLKPRFKNAGQQYPGKLIPENGRIKMNCLFPEHGSNPYNKPDNYNNRDDANSKAGFKNPCDHGTTAQTKQDENG